MSSVKPYMLSHTRLEELYKTHLTLGLSAPTALKQFEKYGPNSLPVIPRASLLRIFLRQFQSPFIYILLFAALAMVILRHYQDGIVVVSILLLNAVIGTILERHAQATVLSLQKYISIKATVIRDGSKKIIDSGVLVPGDLIIVQEGDRIPADARLISAYKLKIDEAILTGESVSVSKTADIIDHVAPLYNQHNMIFSGTHVLTGYAQAIVVATGSQTELGKINRFIKADQQVTPLEKQLGKLSQWLLLFIITFCCALFLLGLILGRSAVELLFTLIALFIAIIPEGLPIVFTIVLASGVYRMAKQKILVTHLQAVEGLGSTDTIVLDKTGTLTRNEMAVLRVFSGKKFYDVTGIGYFPQGEVTYQGKSVVKQSEHDNVFLLAQTGALMNRSSIAYDAENQTFEIRGEPLECAIDIFAQKLQINRQELSQDFTLVYDMPFDSELLMHIAWYKKDNQLWCIAIGAPEAIIKSSKNNALEENHALNKLLQEGLRVIGMAYKIVEPMDSSTTDYKSNFLEKIHGHMNFLGFFGMQDTVRPEVRSMIEKVRSAGLEVIMATGDHKNTAQFVAETTGILKPDDTLIEGKQFDQLTESEIIKQLNSIRVFARFSPQDKLKLIKFLHKKHKIVAMTGDGVNDVPSLIAANIGIAMGKSGTDVARSAADLILLDDSFASIILAIEQGRYIFYTLRRVILYFFATNFSEVLLILFTLIINAPLPLLPAQILWLNVVTDGFLDLGLAMEPAPPDLLQDQWLKSIQKAGLFNTTVLLKIIYMAIPMALIPLLFFVQYYSSGLVKARTVTLTCMCVLQWFNAWNCRSETRSIFSMNFFANKPLLLATTLVICLQMCIIYVPLLQNIFQVTSLTLYEWFAITTAASLIMVFEEIRKYSAHKIYHQRQVVHAT